MVHITREATRARWAAEELAWHFAGVTDQMCRAHHKPLPCCTEKRRAATRRSHAAGCFKNGPRNRADGHTWAPQEIEVLREWAGRVSATMIAERVSALRMGRRRSCMAVQHYAQVHHLSLRRRGYTLNELGHIFGVGRPMLLKWVATGVLEMTDWERSGKSKRLLVASDEQARAFISEHPELYDARYMLPGPLRSFAEVVQRRQRYMDRREAARFLGIYVDTLSRYVRRGVVPVERCGLFMRFNVEALVAAREPVREIVARQRSMFHQRVAA